MLGQTVKHVLTVAVHILVPEPLSDNQHLYAYIGIGPFQPSGHVCNLSSTYPPTHSVHYMVLLQRQALDRKCTGTRRHQTITSGTNQALSYPNRS